MPPGTQFGYQIVPRAHDAALFRANRSAFLVVTTRSNAHHLVAASLKFVGHDFDRYRETQSPQSCAHGFNVSRGVTSQSKQREDPNLRSYSTHLSAALTYRPSDLPRSKSSKKVAIATERSRPSSSTDLMFSHKNSDSFRLVSSIIRS